MKLWLLEARSGLGDNDNPWKPWYDKTFGFVIRAETEEDARQIAHENSANETKPNRWEEGNNQAWLAAKYSTCIELVNDGEVGVIIENHASA